MISKFGKIDIRRTFLVGVPIYPAVPIHPDLRYQGSDPAYLCPASWL